jgi:hypothetical protein
MLRESIKADGQAIDLEGLADPACKEVSGLKNSGILIEYADVFMTRDAAQLADVSQVLEKQMGANALVDAAGVASNFQRMVRIADATGIPADPGNFEAKVDLIEQLGLEQYESAKNTLGGS